MWNKLRQYLSVKGVQLPDTAEETFARYFETLISENEKVNLTRITGQEEVMIKHFLDSLELLAWKPDLSGPVLDVGTGAGFPGFPLKIACPQISLTLLDASRKRVSFLQQTAKVLGFNVTALHGRAEDFGRNPTYREQFPLVVSRAVARLPVLSELCLPFVAKNGYFVAFKGPDGIEELKEAENAISLLGGKTEQTLPYTLPADMGQRTLIIIKKYEPTDPQYPRKAGIPEKRPL